MPDPSSQHVQGLWIYRKVDLKIYEAKDLQGASLDTFVTARLDSKSVDEAQTSTVFKSKTPYWGQKFRFNRSDDIDKLKITLWTITESGEDMQYGRLALPKSRILKGVDDWFVLQPPQPEVPGKVLLSLKYYPPSLSRSVHVVSVIIVKAQDLHKSACFVNRLMQVELEPNAFASVHLTSDLDTFHTTSVKKKNASPEFSESFLCTAKEISHNSKMYISFWNQTSGEAQVSLGYTSIHLSDIIARGTEWTSWFDLTGFEKSSGLPLNGPKLYKNAILSEETQSYFESLPKEHLFIEGNIPYKTCSVCQSMIIMQGVSCSGCNRVYHAKCQKKESGGCSRLGALKVKAECKETIVLPMNLYHPLIEVLEDEDYALPILLGNMSTEREEAAMCMIRIFDTTGTSMKFLQRMFLQELEKATDTQTLFRGNSMASKTWDAYMKIHGMTFLSSVLEPILSDIVKSKKSCELDPEKLSEKDNYTRNVSHLRRYCEKIMSALLKNLHLMPLGFHEMFTFAKKAVMQRFPDDKLVKYTSVSGFLFLRFVVPAILSPRLFNLSVGHVNAQATRNLLLIAKTLQNLANFSKFGQKEAFMTIMNPFLVDNQGKMELLIDLISTKDSDTLPKPKVSSWENIADSDKSASAQNCAELFSILQTVHKTSGLLDNFNNSVKLLRCFSTISRKMDYFYAGLATGTVALDNALDQTGDLSLDVHHERPKKSEDQFSSLPRTSSIIQFRSYYQDSLTTNRTPSTPSLTSVDSNATTDVLDINKALPKNPRKMSIHFSRFLAGLKSATLGRTEYDLESDAAPRRRSSFMNLIRKQSLARVDDQLEGKVPIPLRNSSRDID